MLSAEDSLRFRLLRFPLAVGIVYIHAYNSVVYVASGAIGLEYQQGFLPFIKVLVAEVIARTAVPAYMLMAGYFFFLGVDRGISGYLQKLKARVQSLLVPYLFWNFAVLAVFAVAQVEPHLSRCFSGANPRIFQFKAWDYVNAFLGTRTYPINGPLWFIRDLIIMVLLAPLVRPLAKVSSWIFFPSACLAWVLVHQTWPKFPTPDAWIFFPTGAYLALRRINLFGLDRIGKWILPAYICLALCETSLYGRPGMVYLHRVNILFGIITLLWLTQFIVRSERLARISVQLAGGSFFIYVTHMPIMGFTRKLLYLALKPQSQLALLAIFLFLPVLIITLLLVAYAALIRVFPRASVWVLGGRGKPATEINTAS